MNLNRLLSIRFAVVAFAIGAAIAVASTPATPPAAARERLAGNGTQLTGVRDSHDRYARNGTKVTGVRSASSAEDDGSGGRVALNGTALNGIRLNLGRGQ